LNMTAKLFIKTFIVIGAIVFGIENLPQPTQAALITDKTITFNKEIAPIIYQNCAVCHHSGGSAPFSLMTYQEVKKRAEQIADVTQSRYMPPWLPENHGEFVGERRLTEPQIKNLKLWSEQGKAEGKPADLPPMPKFNEGWQLGQPDLILKMPQAYMLRAGGKDVFRNFVIPVPLTKTRYVKAIEILPGNKKIVHHANILIDRTQSSRELDKKDGSPGFEGMSISIESERFEPDSHFLFWKPDSPPYAEAKEMTWQLDKGTDLVLNMHLQPSGKPEPVQASVGIYFSDTPPTKFPMLLQLEGDGKLDIAAGKKDFVVTDEYRLPLDVDLLGIYPHAHYLGKDIQAVANFPDGTKRELIHIKDWDINRQSVYHYVKPLFLPAGTVISMRWTYDNSTDNIRNPNQPPRRVVAGNNSSDEMSHLWLQVLPRGQEDLRPILQESMMRHWLEKYPEDFTAHFNLGAVLQSAEKFEEALGEYNAALRSKPDDPATLNSLGTTLQTMGQFEAAINQYRKVLSIKPDYVSADYNWGNLLLAAENPGEAVPHFQAVLRTNPEDADAHSNLATAFSMLGDDVQAVEHYRQAIRFNADHPFAHYNLGYILAKQGKLKEAVEQYEQAVRVSPNDPDAHNELGKLYIAQGQRTKAVNQFEQALKLDPQHDEARENLRLARGKP
jgi:Flp pilus assembly protein TadD